MKISFKALTDEQKQQVQKRLDLRLSIFKKFKLGRWQGGILIVGDRPGPSAPKDPIYHHTPFYSTKHCSGWLNAALEVEGISEKNLVWINSADQHGEDTPFDMVERLKPDAIIALGGNAEKWLKKNGCNLFIKVPHPQYHKRFRNSERYELLDVLKQV